MTSDKLMKEILGKMPDEPVSILVLSKITDRPDGNLRKILNTMLELGLVTKETIDEPGNKYRNRTVGWRKTRHI
jgi:predicted transcriptional regulator